MIAPLTQPTVKEDSNVSKTETAPRVHLKYLDGIRGLAALDVAFTHAHGQSNYLITAGGSIATNVLPLITQLLCQGRAAVAIFIVLSGYCLMQPVVMTSDNQLRRGVFNYLKRRAWRILPPYYAALGIILILMVLVPAINSANDPEWHNALPGLTSSAIFSHLLLIHNLNSHWELKINPPMWTVATEWQIYFIFPALLLPMWRRFGNGGAILSGFAIGYLPPILLHRGEGAALWFAGLFALGMAAAVINFDHRYDAHWLQRFPWAKLAGVLFLCFILVQSYVEMPWSDDWTHSNPNWLWPYYWAVDPVLGVATASLLIFCTRFLQDPTGKKPMILRLFQHPWAVGLGTFSYSLYLIHDPILALVHLPLRHATPGVAFVFLTVIGLPVSIGLAYLFHLAFERRFMRGYTK